MLTIRLYRSGNVAVEGPGRRLVAVGDPRTGRLLYRAPGMAEATLAAAAAMVRRYRP